MAVVPTKPEYGPTLGRLLAPSWRAAPRSLRWGTIAAGIALVAIAIAVTLTLLPARYSQGGSMPFSFSYKGLYRVAPEAGGYVRVNARDGHGRLKYSYAVDPLELPAYSGSLSGELPVYATGYAEGLAGRLADFKLRGEGKTRVNKVPGYQVLYTASVEGTPVYGRNVLLAPDRPGARRGVEIAMVTAVGVSSEIKEPGDVASGGVLLRPLKTFTFGG
jgi:hypothetical protein